MRRERAEEAQPLENAEREIHGGNRPRDEDRRLVKIVDRALRDGKAALEHRDRVQRGGGEQQEIIHAVVRAKTFSPQENRVGGADAVTDDGEQKKMPVSEPSHADSLNAATVGAIEILPVLVLVLEKQIQLQERNL